MTQRNRDQLPASSTATDAQPSAGKRTVYILYIPGGAMHGILPGIVMERIEELTELHVTDLFHIFEGVSTGSILALGMNVPDENDKSKPRFTSQDGVELFSYYGGRFFPRIPNREMKMIVSNIFHPLRDRLDPLKQDRLKIRDIDILCDQIDSMAPPDLRLHAEAIRERATKRWISRSDKLAIAKIYAFLDSQNPEIGMLAKKVSELASIRATHRGLKSVFHKAAFVALPVIKRWANGYMFDPNIPKQTFQEKFGDTRMNEMLRSVYISAYDRKTRSPITFYCRKDDFFSTDPNQKSYTNRFNHKGWDAVMASTANPFAYPPHVTENGRVCTDKATIHAPFRSVADALKYKPADADVKLVVLSTGTYVDLDHDERDQVEFGIDYGVAGGLIAGEEMQELEAYVFAQVRTVLGEDHIIEITPRLSPFSEEESLEMPSGDSLDASPDNIEKIKALGQRLLIERDGQIRELCQMLIDNAFILGRIDRAHYERITDKLGIVSRNAMPPVIGPAPTSGPDGGDRGGLRRAFSKIGKLFGMLPPDAEDLSPTPANDDRRNKPRGQTGTHRAP